MWVEHEDVGTALRAKTGPHRLEEVHALFVHVRCATEHDAMLTVDIEHVVKLTSSGTMLPRHYLHHRSSGSNADSDEFQTQGGHEGERREYHRLQHGGHVDDVTNRSHITVRDISRRLPP